MRRLTFAMVVALVAVPLLAGESPRIGVVDMGFAAGRNEFGYMSDPKVFVEALAPVGNAFRVAGCAFTRRAGDLETLDTYCVPGEGATGWVFWNAADKPVSTARDGHEIMIGPERIGYLQVAADGTLEAKEEL